MTTPADPADRYAAYMRSREQDGPALTAFKAMYDFEFDEFQLKACRALNDGHGVLVAAPTGSGKTVVGEFAVHLAISRGRKCFYTTPIKALSNQKYGDLVRRYSPSKVGLLTGDNAVNGDAPVVVDDHRGAAQHALRGLARPERPQPRQSSMRSTTWRTGFGARSGKR